MRYPSYSFRIKASSFSLSSTNIKTSPELLLTYRTTSVPFKAHKDYHMLLLHNTVCEYVCSVMTTNRLTWLYVLVATFHEVLCAKKKKKRRMCIFPCLHRQVRKPEARELSDG